MAASQPAGGTSSWEETREQLRREVAHTQGACDALRLLLARGEALKSSVVPANEEDGGSIEVRKMQLQLRQKVLDFSVAAAKEQLDRLAGGSGTRVSELSEQLARAAPGEWVDGDGFTAELADML